nr:15251_t:CDS:2 [Entrophospora candida]
MKEQGVAAIIMANGTLSGLNKKAANIRQRLVEDNLVDAIITLPNNLFYSTSIAPLSSSERRLTEKEIKNVSQIYQEFHQKGSIEKSTIIPARVILPTEIKEKNYILVPTRYLSQNEVELTPEEIDKKLLKTAGELEELISEQDKYHQELKKLLAEVKKEIESDE